jgi:hypothetical protein
MAHNLEEIPRRLGNYWLHTRLGSGYSGKLIVLLPWYRYSPKAL